MFERSREWLLQSVIGSSQGKQAEKKIPEDFLATSPKPGEDCEALGSFLHLDAHPVGQVGCQLEATMTR